MEQRHAARHLRTVRIHRGKEMTMKIIKNGNHRLFEKDPATVLGLLLTHNFRTEINLAGAAGNARTTDHVRPITEMRNKSGSCQSRNMHLFIPDPYLKNDPEKLHFSHPSDWAE